MVRPSFPRPEIMTGPPPPPEPGGRGGVPETGGDRIVTGTPSGAEHRIYIPHHPGIPDHGGQEKGWKKIFRKTGTGGDAMQRPDVMQTAIPLQ